MRLGPGHDRVPDARPEPRAQPVWGNFSTGGSRGVRESHDYVRKGGAIARMMLVQAAADGWKVPAARMRGGQGRDHAPAERAHDDLRQGLRQRRRS